LVETPDLNAAPSNGRATEQQSDDAERSAKSRSSRLAVSMSAVAVVVTVTAYRLYLVRDATFPGHADKSFYFSVAKNLSAGRGPKIDYIWNFLVPHEHLTHFAFDYWMPLNSVLMAIPMRLFGTDISTALSIEVVLAAVVAFATAWIARELTDTWWIPSVAAVSMVLVPAITAYSVQTEATMPYVAMGALASGAALRARLQPRFWLLAGAFAALAHLSRNEGLLLAAAVVLCSITWSTAARRMNALMAAGAYIALMTPYVVVSMFELGAPLPPASRYFPFIVDYEDLFRTRPLPGVHDLASLGLRGNLDLRLDALVARWSELETQNGVILTVSLLVLVGIAIGTAVRRPQGPWWRSPWLLPVAYGTAAAFLAVVVAPVVSGAGGFAKSGPMLLPFLVTAALIGIARVGEHRRVLSVALIALLVVPSLTELTSLSRTTIRHDNRIGRDSAGIGRLLDLDRQCTRGEIVVMTRDPWEVTEATGYRSVQIPNEPARVIRAVAERWHVTHIVASPNRPQLAPLVAQARADRFTDVVFPTVYRVRSPRTERCTSGNARPGR
jgi:hypothetical protein